MELAKEVIANENGMQEKMQEEACKSFNSSSIIDFNSASEKIQLVASTPKLIHTRKPLKRSVRNHLWIYNINPATNAQDLKSQLSKYGKVVVAKIVKNANKFYGFSIMHDHAGVKASIANLNKTILNDYKIEVRAEAPNVKSAARERSAMNSSTLHLKRMRTKRSVLNKSTNTCLARMKEAMKDMLALEQKYKQQRNERKIHYEKLKKEKRNLQMQKVAIGKQKNELDKLKQEISLEKEKSAHEQKEELKKNNEDENNRLWLQNVLKKAENEIERLKKKVHDNEIAFARLNQDLMKEKTQVKELKKIICVDEKQYLCLKKELAKEKTEIAMLKNHVKDTEKLLMQKNLEIGKLKHRDDNQHLKEQLAKEKMEVENLKRKMREDDEERNKLKREKNALEKDKAELQRRVNENRNWQRTNVWQHDNFNQRNRGMYNNNYPIQQIPNNNQYRYF